MNTATHLTEEDLALFALQLLPDSETAESLTHLEHCETCRQQIASFQGDLAAYAMTSEMHSPPALARQRLMRRVAKEKRVVPVERIPELSASEPMLASRSSRVLEMESPETDRRRGSAVAWIGWAVAAGMAIAAGLQFHQRRAVQSALNAESAKLAQSSADAAKAQDVLQTLTGAGALQVALHLPTTTASGEPAQPEGHAGYIADKGALVFVACHLEPLPQYKTYELWVLPQEDGRDAIPAGTFKPDANGNANVVMPDLPKGVPAKGFGVTVEDDGGSQQPTKPIVLVGL